MAPAQAFHLSGLVDSLQFNSYYAMCTAAAIGIRVNLNRNAFTGRHDFGVKKFGSQRRKIWKSLDTRKLKHILCNKLTDVKDTNYILGN